MPFANQDWPATAGAVLLLAALFGLNNDSPFGTPFGPLFSPTVRRIWRAALCVKPRRFFPLRLFDWHSPCVIRPERTRCSKLIRNALFASRRPYFGSSKPDFDNSKTVDARQLVNKGRNLGNAADRNEALVWTLPEMNCLRVAVSAMLGSAHRIGRELPILVVRDIRVPSSTEAHSQHDSVTRHFFWNSHVQARHQGSPGKRAARSRSDDRHRRRSANGRAFLRRHRAGAASGDARRRLSRGIPDGCSPARRRTHTAAESVAQIALALEALPVPSFS